MNWQPPTELPDLRHVDNNLVAIELGDSERLEVVKRVLGDVRLSAISSRVIDTLSPLMPRGISAA